MAEAVATVDRTLPHNLEAERSVLGAVLIHNDAFNQAAEVLNPRDFYRDAHRRIFEKMIQLSERRKRHRLRHAQGRALPRGRARRSGRPGLHLGARRRPAARHQRRVLRAHRAREVDASQSHLRVQQNSGHRLRGGAGAEPHSRRGRAGDLRDRRRSRARRVHVDAPAGASRASRRSSARTSASSSSPACRRDSPISTS